MDMAPRDPRSPVLTSARWLRLVLLGGTMAAVTLIAATVAPDSAELGTATVAGTMAFTVMSVSTILCALCSRDELG